MKNILIVTIGVFLSFCVKGQEKWSYQELQKNGKPFAFTATAKGTFVKNDQIHEIEVIQFLRYNDQPRTIYFHFNDGFNSSPMLSMLQNIESARISFEDHEGQFNCELMKIVNDNKEVLDMTNLKMINSSMSEEDNKGMSALELLISDIMMSTHFYIYIPSEDITIKFPTEGYGGAMGFLFARMEQIKN